MHSVCSVTVSLVCWTPQLQAHRQMNHRGPTAPSPAAGTLTCTPTGKNTLEVPPVICLRHSVYLVVGSWIHWCPSCLMHKKCKHTNTNSQPPDVLVSPITHLDFLVLPVANSQTYWSLQYLIKPLTLLGSYSSSVFVAITHWHVHPGNLHGLWPLRLLAHHVAGPHDLCVVQLQLLACALPCTHTQNSSPLLKKMFRNVV